MFTGFCKELTGYVFKLLHRDDLAKYKETKERIIEYLNKKYGITVAKSFQLKSNCFHIFEMMPVQPPVGQSQFEYNYRAKAFLRKEEIYKADMSSETTQSNPTTV